MRERFPTAIGVSDFKAMSVDFPNAYKTIGLRGSSMGASAVCFVDPHTNAPRKSRILVQPPGSSLAPEDWGRVVTFAQFIAKELPTLTVGASADDVYCAEPTQLATSGFWDSKRLTGLMGVPHLR